MGRVGALLALALGEQGGIEDWGGRPGLRPPESLLEVSEG
jgi:hypothetical protein